MEKLDESEGRERIAHRHAEDYRRLFERAEGESTARLTVEWMVEYAPEIDNLCTAPDWAFSPCGDKAIGAALTIGAVPLWLQFSIVEECSAGGELAHAWLARVAPV